MNNKNIYQVLKQEHGEVKKLIKDMLQQSEPTPQSLEGPFSQLRDALDIHMAGEEKLFYPPIEQNQKARPDVLEAYEEHHVAKMVLRELSGLAKDNVRWIPKLQVLGDVLDHHIQEEEQTIFKEAQEAIKPAQAEQILGSYQEMKQKRMAPAGV
jgi:iron-sulfur cluster repair protein YtfE (RIC family)